MKSKGFKKTRFIAVLLFFVIFLFYYNYDGANLYDTDVRHSPSELIAKALGKDITNERKTEEDGTNATTTTTTTTTTSSTTISTTTTTKSDATHPSVWISMAVCWSSNTQFYGKVDYPYAYATRLSSMLWANRTTHKVIVYVIFPEEKEEDKGLVELVEELRKSVAIVKTVPAGNINCPLKSQLQRMFGFVEPEVSEDDFVVTSDVDAFVKDRDIFENLKEENTFKVWIYQYSAVAGGGTIPISFVAMKKTLWRQLMSTDTVENLLESLNATFSYEIGSVLYWEYDQFILSHLILKSNLCTADHGNEIWKAARLKPPDKPVDDSKTCFRGFDWWNCFASAAGLEADSPGCKWWHFTSSANESTMKERFDYIVNL